MGRNNRGGRGRDGGGGGGGGGPKVPPRKQLEVLQLVPLNDRRLRMEAAAYLDNRPMDKKSIRERPNDKVPLRGEPFVVVIDGHAERAPQPTSAQGLIAILSTNPIDPALEVVEVMIYLENDPTIRVSEVVDLRVPPINRAIAKVAVAYSDGKAAAHTIRISMLDEDGKIVPGVHPFVVIVDGVSLGAIETDPDGTKIVPVDCSDKTEVAVVVDMGVDKQTITLKGDKFMKKPEKDKIVDINLSYDPTPENIQAVILTLVNEDGHGVPGKIRRIIGQAVEVLETDEHGVYVDRIPVEGKSKTVYYNAVGTSVDVVVTVHGPFFMGHIVKPVGETEPALPVNTTVIQKLFRWLREGAS